MQSEDVELIWPERLKIRDTGLHDDLGGPGQRIYTTAGRGYERVEYVRADLYDALLAERDAAFAAGQEEMRERAAKAAEMAFHTGAGANDLLAAHNGGIIMAQNHIRALSIKDSPDGR